MVRANRVKFFCAVAMILAALTCVVAGEYIYYSRGRPQELRNARLQKLEEIKP